MSKGREISKVSHAEFPEHIFIKIVEMIKDMALDGDLDAATWIVSELVVLKRTITMKEFSALKKTAGFKSMFYGKPCVSCGAPSNSIDHIIPVSSGGTNDLSNLQPMCKSCNSKKSNEL